MLLHMDINKQKEVVEIRDSDRLFQKRYTKIRHELVNKSPQDIRI